MLSIPISVSLSFSHSLSCLFLKCAWIFSSHSFPRFSLFFLYLSVLQVPILQVFALYNNVLFYDLIDVIFIFIFIFFVIFISLLHISLLHNIPLNNFLCLIMCFLIFLASVLSKVTHRCTYSRQSEIS